MNPENYIKPKSKDYTSKVKELEDLLPFYTEHLNVLTSSNTQLQSILRFFKSTPDSNSSKEFEEMENQVRFNFLLTVSLLDLIVISKSILITKHLWEEIYLLRQGYLTIYETIKTYKKHTNLIKSLAYKNSDSTKPLFDKLTLELREFKKKYNYDSTIADIRNYTIGHIDSDCLNYFQKISSFNTDKATDALIAFINILIQMQGLSKDIAIIINEQLNEKVNQTNVSINSYVIEINKLFKELENRIKTN